MGAHQSSENLDQYENMTKDGTLTGYNGGKHTKGYHGNKQGKPSPPQGIPLISEVTHNSLSLSWQPPRYANGGSIIAYLVEMFAAKEKQWVYLTKSCQGNCYKVRSLQPDSRYHFRVRAENIYGRSKPGAETEVVQTSSFDVHDFSPSKNTNDNKVTVKRRHSLHIQVPVEGRVSSILNHTSAVVATTHVKGDESRTTLQRDGLRSSLQNGKKRSGSSLIPGTKTNSLQRLRTSQSKLPNGQEVDPKNGSDKICVDASLERLNNHCDSDTRSDIGSECNTLSQSSTSDSFDREQGLNDKNMNTDGIHGDPILTAPVCDDIKIALYSKTVDSYSDEKLHIVSDEGIDTSRSTTPDFRTLRSMLQSADVIIKPTQSLPEISDVCRGKSGRGSARNKLSTIVDEENDDSVRITTL